jgi:3'-phosphoadenosine 5'-phosphosulfate sulfotransferase
MYNVFHKKQIVFMIKRVRNVNVNHTYKHVNKIHAILYIVTIYNSTELFYLTFQNILLKINYSLYFKYKK